MALLSFGPPLDALASGQFTPAETLFRNRSMLVCVFRTASGRRDNNLIAVGDQSDTIALMGGGNSVGGGGDLNIVFDGADNDVFLAAGATSIADHSNALEITVNSPDTLLTISSYNAVSGAVVDLVGTSFAAVGAVLSALKGDGSGGTILSLGYGGEIHFIGLSQIALTASSSAVSDV